MATGIAQGKIRRGRAGVRSTKKALAVLETGEALALPTFAVAALPAAATYAGRLVSCSNGAAGAACLLFSNGTAWKVVALGATASAT